MTRDEILAGIAEVARRHLDHEGPLALDQRLVEDLELDSIRLLTLAAEIENHFRVTLDGDDEATLTTIADLVTLLAHKLAAR